MSEKEPHKPTLEEIKKAEDSMDDDQRILAKRRERIFREPLGTDELYGRPIVIDENDKIQFYRHGFTNKIEKNTPAKYEEISPEEALGKLSTEEYFFRISDRRMENQT